MSANKSMLIKGAELWTMESGILKATDLFIKDGKIQEIGKDLKVSADTVIEAEGLIVLPGIIDAHSHISTMSARGDDQDSNEMTAPATPDVSIIHGFSPGTPVLKKALESGITAVGLIPGSGNVIGGEGIAIRTHGTNTFEMVLKRPIALKCATGFNPKNVYGPRNERPMTRMGIAQILRESLQKGLEYRDAKLAAKKEGKKAPDYDQGLEILEKVINREIPLKAHTGGTDILTIIEIAKEFGVNYTLDHASDAKSYVKQLKEYPPIGVILGPFGGPTRTGIESRDETIASAFPLVEAGIVTAIMTDNPVLHTTALIHEVGSAVRMGMEPYEAMKMITINAAKILSCDDRIGSLAVGKDADLVFFKGTPALDTNAKVVRTIVLGETVFEANGD